MTLLLVIVLALAAMALAARLLQARALPLAERVDAVLPQTQCRQCGYDGCRPYAQAIATGAAINRCPPGGERVLRKLAVVTGQPRLPLDTSRGAHQPPRVAAIDEARCIGCTLCIQACPVDAIVGAPKLMHTVIAAHCTGCDLCLPPCPVDCIVLAPRPWAADLVPGRRRADADAARRRFRSRASRLERERRRNAERMAAKAERKLDSLPAADPAQARKRAIVAAALERARQRLAATR
jgi:Na+-translocating ferredoxin:NAD+ oxidoreductase subunit B